MMTRDEAQRVLLRYRPGTADAVEPEIAEALALAKQDPDLSRWLDRHCAQQETLRSRIRSIPVPAGLKEQIISERPASTQQRIARRTLVLAAASVCLVGAGWWASVLWHQPPNDDTFANFQRRMVSTALRGYAMDFESSDPAGIRDYLARQNAPESYDVPAGLQKAAPTGCAIESWQGAKVAMLCFHTGQGTPAAGKTDAWLFVVDRNSVKGAPVNGEPQFSKVNKLMTATWARGDKLYMLGMAGDEPEIRQWF